MSAAVRSHRARPFAVAIVAVLLTTCAGPRREAAAFPLPPGERRSFPVLEYGSLSIEIPAGWKVRVLELAPGTPVSVRLDPLGGGALFLAPVFDPEAEGPALEAAALFTEIARRKALGSAAERDVPTAILRGADGAELGYWFVVTDREYVPPPPGQERWPSMLRGAVSAGRLLVTFSWFDEGPGPTREEVLSLVRSARHEPPAAGAFELTPDPGATTVPLAVREPGGTFAVLVDLPGFELYAPRPSPDGAGYLVLGQHKGTGIVTSITIGPAGGATSARACRDRKLARLRQVAPDLAEVRTAEAGEGARLRYALSELRGREIRQEHAHAFLLRDGRCVDVHASKADPDAADAGRLDAILATVRFAAAL